MFSALNLFMVLFTIFSISWSDFVVGIQIWTFLAHRKSTETLLELDFKLRNKLKSKCVQFFDTHCTWDVNSNKVWNMFKFTKTTTNKLKYWNWEANKIANFLFSGRIHEWVLKYKLYIIMRTRLSFVTILGCNINKYIFSTAPLFV